MMENGKRKMMIHMKWCTMNEDLQSIILDNVNCVDFSDFVENVRKRPLVNKST